MFSSAEGFNKHIVPDLEIPRKKCSFSVFHNPASLFYFTLSLLSRICSQQHSSRAPWAALLCSSFDLHCHDFFLQLGCLEKVSLVLTESSKKLPRSEIVSHLISPISVLHPSQLNSQQKKNNPLKSDLFLSPSRRSFSVNVFHPALIKMSHIFTIHLQVLHPTSHSYLLPPYVLLWPRWFKL